MGRAAGHTGLFSLGNPEGILIKGATQSHWCLESSLWLPQGHGLQRQEWFWEPGMGGGQAPGLARPRGQRTLMVGLAVGPLRRREGSSGLLAAASPSNLFFPPFLLQEL